MVRVSYNWLSELIDLKAIGSPQKLAELLTSRGLEVEEIESQSKGLDDVISAHILEKGVHPNSDRLSFCKVDAGKGQVFEIVCGAQNHKTGDKVALAMVGADLPNGLKIGKSKIRGVESQGMLCSEAELGLSKESEGIIILPKDTPIGKPIAEILGRDDTILTLKVYANQGHWLSHVGVAREIAAALGVSFKKPEPSVSGTALKLDFKKCSISIDLQVGDKAPQFFGCLIEGVKIGPSPASVVKKLESVGLRSINNVVDASNLVMMELGHPVHAYDADKISGSKIGVRLAKPSESLPLLDGTQVSLSGQELVIFDAQQSIGLAGVMGGGNSEVLPTTSRVFLECAEFDSVLVRKAKTKHQKLTDAAHRFERGIDPKGLEHVISRFASLVIEFSGGKVTGSTKAQVKEVRDPAPIMYPKDFTKNFLGIEASESEIKKHFESLDCKVTGQGANFLITPPSYRLDLKIKEDLAEEIARSVGYDKIPSTVPVLTSTPTSQVFEARSANQVLIDRAKESLVKLGLWESVNLAFTSTDWLKSFGLESSVRIQNPLSADHEALVPSLIPGLVKNALHNWHHHFGSENPPIRLFELRPVYEFKGTGVPHALNESDTGILENWKLALALSGPRFASGLKADLEDVDFYDFKNMIESFLDSMGAKGVRFKTSPSSKLVHPGKSVEILMGNQSAGFMGLLHPATAKNLKVKKELWIAELDWQTITKLCRPASQSRTYKAWSEFPPIERDFAFVVDQSVTAEQIVSLLQKSGKPLVKQAKVFDVYSGTQVPAGKVSIAARVILQDDTRSLQEAEAESTSQAIVNALKKELNAELR